MFEEFVFIFLDTFLRGQRRNHFLIIVSELDVDQYLPTLFSNTYIKVCWRKKCSPLLKWEFLFVPFPDRLMDDVSLSHSEIDFICNKIRGEAVAFSNYTGIFLIQQQYGKNCITDIPIFRPFEFFSLVFPELVVTSSDFFC